MKNNFKRQFESLIQQRSRERDRKFNARLVEVMQEHNRRGILMSSIAVVAMHRELERELRESADECVRATVDIMTGRPTVLPLPRKRAVVRVCLNMLARRKAALEGIFLSRARNIFASLSNSSFIGPYRSLSEDFVELQRQNARVKLLARHSELFWLKLNRVQKLVPLLKLRPLIVLAAMVVLYFGGFEIAQSLKEFYGHFAAVVQDYLGG